MLNNKIPPTCPRFVNFSSESFPRRVFAIPTITVVHRANLVNVNYSREPRVEYVVEFVFQIFVYALRNIEFHY
jgi:hypothetical protein